MERGVGGRRGVGEEDFGGAGQDGEGEVWRRGWVWVVVVVGLAGCVWEIGGRRAPWGSVFLGRCSWWGFGWGDGWEPRHDTMGWVGCFS